MSEQHVCVVCGWIHEENSDMPWHETPPDYVCPECGVGKDEFEAI